MPEWTKEQQQAIDGRAGSLLVSAAAGSGKTTVLVERVIRRLTDLADPCPADSLVIVTFTRAAASQMKERIEIALNKLIAQGADPWLMKQQLLLQSAKICTIDSFCGDLVRENFHSLGISADFKIIDESENEAYKERAVGTVLERMYKEKDEDFLRLVNTVSAGGSDKALSEVIKNIYSSVASYPFPEDEIQKLAQPYFEDKEISQTLWGKYILTQVGERLKYCRSLMEYAASALGEVSVDAATYDALEPLVSSEVRLYAKWCELADEGWWNELYDEINRNAFARMSAKRNLDAAVKETVKLCRDEAKKVVAKIKESLLCCSAEEFYSDREELRGIASALLNCVTLYGRELNEIKRADLKFDFNDVEHLALDLLVEKDSDGNPVKTALAEHLSKSYREIMVDEYQDTNKLQDMIFSAISDSENNLFFVGDVKQSIYRFRQAMPEIFLKRRDDVPEFDGDNYPARVTLGANFRSRNTVTGAVNFVFEKLMSEKLGEIDYNQAERLNPRAVYPEKSGADVEFYLRDSALQQTEPQFVAQYVADLLKSGMLIKDGDTQRPIRAGDIALLLRHKKRMQEYAQALESAGIPAACSIDGEISGSAEVRIILSLLRVLDNPLQDVALTAVMLSPVFGFTPDELAEMRIGVKRNTPVYRSVFACAENGNEKAIAFLNRIDGIRRLSIGMGAAEFLRRLYDETDIMEIASAMPDHESRVANLWALLDKASSFDSSGGCGLSSFLRYLDNMKNSSTAFDCDENSDAVKVMTIHKSKGLEFGVCIVADLASQLLHNETDGVVLSRGQGIGLLLRDRYSGKTVRTLPFASAALNSALSDLSEETRVLYVALTRAKEKLVLVGTTSKPREKLLTTPIAFSGGTAALSYGYASTASNALSWLVPIFASHLQAADFRRDITDSLHSFTSNPDFEIIAKVCDDEAEACEQKAAEHTASACTADEALIAQIKERMDYVYPYALLSKATAKKQASGFLDENFDDTYFASSRPAFMNTGKLSAAQKGTLTHRFMQICDLNNCDIIGQIDSMVEQGKFTKAEAQELNIAELEAFNQSQLCRRIRSSPLVMREKKFAMLMPVTQVYPDLPSEYSEEKIVVQGMLDLAFVENGDVVVVDYKTDRGVEEDELRERHFEQISVYAKAIEKCTDYKVKEAYIYSLTLKKAIKVL